MKLKKRKKILITSILIIATIIIFIINAKPYHLYHFYPGDKITLNIEMFLDDEEVPVEIKDLTCKYEGRNKKVKIGTDKDICKISTRGSQYGMYKFQGTILYEGKEEPININIMKFNNWDIMTYDIKCYQYSNLKNEYCVVDLEHKNKKGNDVHRTCEKALVKEKIQLSLDSE